MAGFDADICAVVDADEYEFDLDKLMCISTLANRQSNWAAETLAGLGLDDIPDEEVVKDGVELTEEAEQELLHSLKELEKVDFDSDGSGISRKSNFTSSTGNSSLRSTTSAKMARNYKANKLERNQLSTENANLKKAQEEKDKQHTAREQSLLARIQELESLAANKQGSPHLSGSIAADSSLQAPVNEPGSSAAMQG
jgi:hypothetical protein